MIRPQPPSGAIVAHGGGTAALVRRARRLADAIDTMMRGTAFLHARAAIIERRGASSIQRHAMVLANALRELDCFLLVLLDELAVCGGLNGPALRAFRRRRNAARKLSAYPALFGAQAEDQDLLLALTAQKTVLLRIFAGPRRSRARTPRFGDIAPVAHLPAIDLKTISAYYADLSVRLIGHADGLHDTRRIAG